MIYMISPLSQLKGCSLITGLNHVFIVLAFLLSPLFSKAANHTEVIEVMQPIKLKYTAWSESTMDVTGSRVWYIEDSSKGVCWPDGTIGYKTCNATDATVIGFKPYDGTDTNVEHTIWYVDTDGFRSYVKDNYLIKVLEPSRAYVDWNYWTMYEGDSRQIEIRYSTFSDGRYYYTEYSSSNPDVLEIDENGKYTGVKHGKATLTVKEYIANRDYPDINPYLVYSESKEIEVKEKIVPTSLSIVNNPVYCARRDDGRIVAEFTFQFTPEDSNVFPGLDYILNSDNSIIATSESLEGYWSSLSSGSGYRRIKVKFYPSRINNEEVTTWVFTTSNGLEARCKVIFYDPVESVTFDKTELQINAGEDAQLTATVMPENATYKDLIWTSEDESVATVDNTGKVHALKRGMTKITAKSEIDNIEAVCELTVTQPVEAIYLSKSEINLKPGEFETITAYVSPEDADNKSLIWKSLDEAVAKVENGTIMAIGNGNTVVKALASDDSGISAQCRVTVDDGAGIEEVLTDTNIEVKIYNLQGVLVYEGIYSKARLAPDYYLIVSGSKSAKIKVE